MADGTGGSSGGEGGEYDEDGELHDDEVGGEYGGVKSQAAWCDEE